MRILLPLTLCFSLNAMAQVEVIVKSLDTLNNPSISCIGARELSSGEQCAADICKTSKVKTQSAYEAQFLETAGAPASVEEGRKLFDQVMLEAQQNQKMEMERLHKSDPTMSGVMKMHGSIAYKKEGRKRIVDEEMTRANLSYAPKEVQDYFVNMAKRPNMGFAMGGNAIDNSKFGENFSDQVARQVKEVSAYAARMPDTGFFMSTKEDIQELTRKYAQGQLDTDPDLLRLQLYANVAENSKPITIKTPEMIEFDGILARNKDFFVQESEKAYQAGMLSLQTLYSESEAKKAAREVCGAKLALAIQRVPSDSEVANLRATKERVLKNVSGFLKSNLSSSSANGISRRLEKIVFIYPMSRSQLKSSMALSLRPYSKENSEEADWEEVERSCSSAYTAKSVDDRTISHAGVIHISPWLAKVPEMADEILGHEIGHNIRRMKAGFSKHSSDKQHHLESCLMKMHLPRDRKYIEEDYADFVGSSVAQGELSACFFVDRNTSSMEADLRDPHSTNLFRLVRQSDQQNRKIPTSCNSVVEKHPKRECKY